MNAPELDFASEDMQRMVERFACAKWITGTNVVTPHDLKTTFTELGHAHMRGIAETLKAIAPTVFNLPPQTTSRLKLIGFKIKFFIQLAVVGRKLRKPSLRWRDGERGALIALICGYAMKHRSVIGTRPAQSTTATQKAFSPPKRW